MSEYAPRPNKDGRTDLTYCRLDGSLYVIDAIDNLHARLIPADEGGAPYANGTPIVVRTEDIDAVRTEGGSL